MVAEVVAALAVASALALFARRQLPRWRDTPTPAARDATGPGGGVGCGGRRGGRGGGGRRGRPGRLAGHRAERSVGSQPEPRPWHPAEPPRAAVHPDRPVRPAGVAGSFRGKVVLLAFNDSECTTICPLTTAAMLAAQAKLGAAGSRVQLLGVDANPKATSLEDVLSYSQLHGMLHAWHFLTGPLAQLKRVWKAYGIEAAIQGGQIAHTPALFVIDPQGRLAKLYMTQQSYAAVGQLAQLLARRHRACSPTTPRCDRTSTTNRSPGSPPPAPSRCRAPAAGPPASGRAGLASILFFATWDREVTASPVSSRRCADTTTRSARGGLPPLTAVDEHRVEPSPAALTQFLATLPRPLTYPVAIDRTDGSPTATRSKDNHGFVPSPTGQILWYWQVATSGWLTQQSLIAHVRDAPAAPANAATASSSSLAPAPLASLHAQGRRLLGSGPGLLARVHELRGYPVVINAWASWCAPCRSEFGLLAAASARYGRQVAFLGADTQDSAADAQAFLAQHPVSYPSYETSISGLAHRPAGPRRPAHHYLPQPRRQAGLRTQRAVRVARRARC